MSLGMSFEDSNAQSRHRLSLFFSLSQPVAQVVANETETVGNPLIFLRVALVMVPLQSKWKP